MTSFGLCVNKRCTDSNIGFNLIDKIKDAIPFGSRLLGDTDGIQNGLTVALLLVPLACGFAFLAGVFSLFLVSQF